MTELVGNWLHFTPRQPKRKRAELVCIFCHSKKVKCDLQSRNTQGHQKCTNCDTQDRECRLRPSKRGKQRRKVFPLDQPQDEVEATSPKSIEMISPLLELEPTSNIDIAEAQLVEAGDKPSYSMTAVDDVIQVAMGSNIARSNSVLSHTALSSGSPAEGAGRSHAGDVDTGFLQVYGPENQFDAEQQEFVASLGTSRRLSDPRQRELQQSFSETYFEFCYPWCPVLDRDTLTEDLARSPMLANALALAASHIRPPLVPHQGTESYYDKAKSIFYNDEEPDCLTALKSITLFYWWAPRPPSTAHRHSSWWWTSVIIRHAQQMNLHREPGKNHPLRDQLDLGLRRRIWWTVFARERLTALCQSKPCIIDPDDCNIKEPQPSDFPSDPVSQHKGQIFIYWVRLCAIIGKIAKALSRSSDPTAPAFLPDLRQELADWVNSLPPSLQLPIGSTHTESFDRDVHQLHLPYLTTVIILHLRKRDDLPQALPPAILAASCIARIMRDILSRGNTRFLMAISCWYCGTAFIALLQARRIPQFSQEAEEGLECLTHAVSQLQNMWGSANVVRHGFERLRKSQSAPLVEMPGLPNDIHQDDDREVDMQSRQGLLPNVADSFDWTVLFPFVTRATNKIADCLLRDRERGTMTTSFPSPENALVHEALLYQYQDLLEPFIELPFDMSDINFTSLAGV